MRQCFWVAVLMLAYNPLFSYARAEWIPLKSPQPCPVSPQFIHNGNCVSLYIQLPGFHQSWSPEHERYEISIPGAGTDWTPGVPRLPVLSYVIALPGSTISSIKVHYVSSVTFVHVPVVINGAEISVDAESPNSTARYHHELPEITDETVRVRVENLGKIQGWDIVKVSLFPFRADLATADLHAAENFKVDLCYAENGLRVIAPASQFSEMVDWKPDNFLPREIPSEYLIVTPSRFVEALTELITWRTAEGLAVTVKTTEQIKQELGIPGLLSADRLQEYLSLYYNREPNLTYVLLVGDVEFIPVKYKNDDATDIFYSLLDGSGDRLPDVYLGRLPVNSDAEIRAITAKIIATERVEPGKRILLASYFQDAGLDGISDRDYVYTSELFRSYLTTRQYLCGRVYTKTPGSKPAYYSNYEPVPPDITFDGKTQDIVNFINIGAEVVNHRDHGTARGWENPPFHVEDLDKLWNSRYPLVFNIDCETGKFDQETELDRRETEGTPLSTHAECFSELLLTLPDKGAVAVIAPSRSTTNPLNNTFDRGLMEAIWPRMFNACHSPATRLGQVLYRARIKLVHDFCGNGWVDERVFTNFRQYNLLGDPALRLRLPQ